jgi:hypothetical protein
LVLLKQIINFSTVLFLFDVYLGNNSVVRTKFLKIISFLRLLNVGTGGGTTICYAGADTY